MNQVLAVAALNVDIRLDYKNRGLLHSRQSYLLQFSKQTYKQQGSIACFLTPPTVSEAFVEIYVARFIY